MENLEAIEDDDEDFEERCAGDQLSERQMMTPHDQQSTTIKNLAARIALTIVRSVDFVDFSAMRRE